MGAEGLQAGKVLEKVVKANAAPVPFGGRGVPSAVGIGASSWPGHGDTERDLLHNAEAAPQPGAGPGRR